MPVHPVTKYARDVVKGRELACKYVRQACQRHLDDLKRKDVYFDTKAADLALSFARLLPHVQGELRGKPFIPHASQEFLLGSIFGWKESASGLRRFSTVYIEIPRKNAKSFLGSAIGLIGLMVDGEGGAEVYSVATKKEQAMKVWDVARSMVKMVSTLKKRVRPYHNSLVYSQTDSVFKPLASDEDKLDGLNPHIVIADEIHAWPNRELWDVMIDGMGGRTQAMIAAITTAGYNQTGICWELRNHVINLLQQAPDFSDNTFGYIATLDEGDDWRNPKVWKKANPLLGTAKSQRFLEQEVKSAMQIPGKENAVKNKQFNLWTKAEKKWLEVEQWKELEAIGTIDELKGKRCIAGADLSSVSDLTSVVYLFQDDGRYKLWPTFFLPEDVIKAKNNVPYDSWQSKGWIFGTPGNVVDYGFVLENIKLMNEVFEIDEVAVDPHNGTQLSIDLREEGFDVVLVTQNFTNLSAPSKEFERLVLAKEIEHNGNPIMQWNVGNAVVRIGPTGNYLPDKLRSSDKIDGVAATITALARHLTREQPKQSVYEGRGLRVIR